MLRFFTCKSQKCVQVQILKSQLAFKYTSCRNYIGDFENEKLHCFWKCEFLLQIVWTCRGQRYHASATHCNKMQHTTAHCNTMQHTATHCNTLQHTATSCKYHGRTRSSGGMHGKSVVGTHINFLNEYHQLQHTATHCNTLQRTAAHCNTLQTWQSWWYSLETLSVLPDRVQHTATHCTTLLHSATHCDTLQYTATHCNTLQLPANVTLDDDTLLKHCPSSQTDPTPSHCRSSTSATHTSPLPTNPELHTHRAGIYI